MDLARAVCAGAILCAWAAAFGGVAHPQGLDPKPDLVVNLRSSEPDWPRNDAEVTITVRNIGGSRAPLADCRVIIRQAHAPRQVLRTIKKAVRALAAGDQYTFTFPVKVGLGSFEITATVDRKNKIVEADETNNEARITIVGQ
jgi:hypothetical protein